MSIATDWETDEKELAVNEAPEVLWVMYEESLGFMLTRDIRWADTLEAARDIRNRELAREFGARLSRPRKYVLADPATEWP